MPSIPFRMPTIRQKQSKPTIACTNAPDEEDMIQLTPNRTNVMQDFLKTTGANLKATGANLRAQSVRLPSRMQSRRDRQRGQPVPEHDSQARSLDISDDVLDRLMGPPKDLIGSKFQSDDFLLKQRIRASSKAAAVTALPPSRARSHTKRYPTALSAEETQAMFVGAPYFTTEQTIRGGSRARVHFRGGDSDERARYGTDYASLGHSSFAASTLGLHWTEEREVAESKPKDNRKDHRIGEGERLLEIPSMLGANGLDPGTVGFEHFLQLPIADSAVLPDEPTLFEKRKLLYSDPERIGLRELNMEALIDRLTELDTDRNEPQEALNDIKIAEMGEDLFARLLDLGLEIGSAGTGGVSFFAQLTALQKVLSETELWYDFSQVEWRIRVGQVLWASEEQDNLALDEGRQPSKRDVLLLQTSLAAELLLRMNALKHNSTMLSDEERAVVEGQQTKKLEWDLLVAERFLENLAISAKASTSSADKRSSRFSVISFFTARETDEDVPKSVESLLFPKNEAQQLEGLLYFAEAIQWPHIEDVRRDLAAKLEPAVPRASLRSTQGVAARPVSGVSEYMTPLSSPRLPGCTSSTDRHSYFGDLAKLQQTRPMLNRVTTAQTMQLLPATASGAGQEAFEVGGWLSRSWLSGLTLPGEPASHFLISTLLENSPQAVEVLGDSANLYGGFVYSGASFWSKSSAVGRVMAASKGARDCMGWISVPDAPQGQVEGWVDVETKEAPSSETTARINKTGVVVRNSDPFHGSDPTSLQAGDFRSPVDGPLVMGNEVKCLGFSFFASQTFSEITKSAEDLGVAATSPHIAHLSFESPVNAKLPAVSVSLTYDVHFIASYPCHPGPNVKPRTASKPIHPPLATKFATLEAASFEGSATISPISSISLTSPPNSQPPEKPGEIDQVTVHPYDSAHTSTATSLSLKDMDKELPSPPAHPLHNNFQFVIIPVASLLSCTAETVLPRSLCSPEFKGRTKLGEEVVVLDCRGTEDLELLARAWCAQVGEHAVVGRSGRTCLACCVREARALGVGVVIRT